MTKLSSFDLGYLKAAAEDEAHGLVLRLFLEAAGRDPAITRAFLAKRSGKKPEQVTRLLGSPGNWTLDTLTVLLAALGYKPVFGAEKIGDLRWDNDRHPLVAEDTDSSSQPHRVMVRPSAAQVG